MFYGNIFAMKLVIHIVLCLSNLHLFINSQNTCDNPEKTIDFKTDRDGCRSKIREQSNYNYWKDYGVKHLRQQNVEKNIKKAKNIILFIGDGMNIDSVTGGRIEAGRQKSMNTAKGCGEEYEQFIESFPFTGLSKTYSVDAQTPDSASTATALFTGVKAPYLTVGMMGSYSASKRTGIMGWVGSFIMSRKFGIDPRMLKSRCLGYFWADKTKKSEIFRFLGPSQAKIPFLVNISKIF